MNGIRTVLVGTLFLGISLHASLGERMRSYPELRGVFRALWGDDVESKIDVIDSNATSNLTTEGTINTKITQLSTTALTSSLISSGTISLDTSGNYALSEDMAADIDISASNISVDLNHRCLTGVVTIDGGGSDITDISISNGFIKPAAPFTTPAAGITVASDVLRIDMEDIMIVCDDTTADGIAGRSCIEIAGDFASVLDCYLVSGAGGSASSGNGPAGGDGIELTSTSTDAILKDCFIITGDGGNSTDGTSDGGRGGHGVYVNGASQVRIRDCIINLTGSGGTDAGSGSRGDGGDAIHITSTSTETEVMNCILRNTGSGAAAATSGKAINDLVPAADPGKSIIWSNIATVIANSSIRFEIGNTGLEKGVALTYPTTTTAVNVYANVYVA